MKKTTLALLAIMAASPLSSFAAGPQDRNISTPLPSALTTASNVIGPGEAPAAKAPMEVNPFTGKPLSVEQIQRELEEAKLRTQMLEEALKQSNLREEITNVPLRKAVEAAQARTAAKKEEFGQRDMEELHRAASLSRAAESQPKPVKASRDAVSSKSKTAASKSDTKRAPVAANTAGESAPSGEDAPATPSRSTKPVLMSVIEVSGQRAALIDFGGNTLVAQDGGMTPVGPLKILDGTSVNLNGETYRVHGVTLSRFFSYDNKAPAAAVPAHSATPAQASVPVPSAPQRTALPPIQLPPGATVLPPSVPR